MAKNDKQLKKLNQKQKLFCEYFVQTGHKANSYKRAFQMPGKLIKDSSCRSNASRLLAMDIIQEYISELRAERQQEFKDMEQAEVLSTVQLLRYLQDILDTPSSQNATIKAVELYAKVKGGQFDKNEVQVGGEIRVVLPAPEDIEQLPGEDYGALPLMTEEN